MNISGEEGRGSRRRIVKLLRENGALTRAEISRLSGLSRSAVSTVVGELVSSGVAVEQEEVRRLEGLGRVGRPGVLVTLNPNAGAAVGIDVGHRYLKLVVADLAHRVLAEAEYDLPADHEAGEALGVAERLTERTLSEASVDRSKVVGVGLGLAGPIERTTGEIHASSISPTWVGTRPAEALSERLALPVHLENGANMAALAELLWGAARGVSDAVYVTISDGIGAGLIVDGKVYRGAVGTAGEIGHTVMVEDGPICRCGNRGCLEVLAATPALLELLRPARGPELTIGRVLELAADGDAACRRAIGDSGRLVGVALANVCNLFNPERVIVGGQLSEAGEVLLEPLRTSLRHNALQVAARAEVVPGSLSARARALGGVAMVLRETDSFVATNGAAGGVTDIA